VTDGPREPAGRVAAVDYGRRRIGLAISDPLRITTRGLPTLPRDADLAAAARATAQVLLREGAALVVVGLPLHADGRESEMSAEVRRFATLLEEAGLAVTLHDEGLTSWEAEEGLKGEGRGLERARKDGEIDRRAALGLLRGWLAEPR
jgi:putative Holliday junction resolvase